MYNLLIADDEPAICASLSFALEDDFRVHVVHAGEEALDYIRRQEIEIVLLDLKLGDRDGIEILKRMKVEKPQLVIIIMTAFGSIQSSVNAMKAGAFYYVTKPLDMDELHMLLANAVEYIGLKTKVQYLNHKLTEVYEVAGIIGASSAMRQILSRVEKLKNSDVNVLITGESGTGKELVAKALHYGSVRRNEPFEVVNCAAIPFDLLESELFGHEKGAFTSATQSRKGLFELADRGTLFLDEIAEMDPRLQAKLLRVVQEKEIMPVGSGQRKKIDVRILCATNRNLEQIVREGRFREDLYFRLNVVNIHLPSLKERREDIPRLLDYFVIKYSRKMGKAALKIEDEAVQALMHHEFRGNVRELENIIEKTIVLLDGDSIGIADLPLEVRQHAPALAPCLPDGTIAVSVGQDLKHIEKAVIQKTLKHFGGDKQRTAKALKISERKLWYKLKEYEQGGE